ncbi:MAG: hypothetical protein ABWY38_06155 [Methyloceanibacter sp.]
MSFRDRYRPERHYMRGPGPKWHAKHRALVALPAEEQRRSLSLWIVPATVAALLGFFALAALA